MRCSADEGWLDSCKVASKLCTASGSWAWRARNAQSSWMTSEAVSPACSSPSAARALSSWSTRAVRTTDAMRSSNL